LCLFTICCGHPSESADGLYSKGRQQFEHGDLSSALATADQGLQTFSGDQIANFKFLVLKAQILQWQTKNEEVLRLLSTAPPPELSQGEFAIRAKALQGLAFAFLGDHEKAEALLNSAYALAERNAPEMRSLVILYKGNQAKKEHQPSLAEEYYQQALQLTEQYHQPFIEMSAKGSLGEVATGATRFDDAFQWYMKSLDLADSTQARLVKNILLGDMAWNYQQLGDIDKAISYFDQQQKQGLESLGQEQIQALAYTHMGETYVYQGNYSAAKDSYEKALAIVLKMQREKRSGEQLFIEQLSDDLAELDLEMGAVEKAEQHFRRSSQLDPCLPGTVLVSGKIAAAHHSFKEAVSLLRQLTEPGSEHQCIHWDKQLELDNQFVRWDAQAELARAYSSEGLPGLAKDHFESLIHQVEETRSSLRMDDHRLPFSFHANRYYDDYVNFLVQTGQRRLAFQVTEFSRGRALAAGIGLKAPRQPTDISIEAIQAFLRKNGKIILSYWLTPTSSYLWLISGSQFQLFTLPSDHVIEDKSAEYTKLVQSARNADVLETQGQALYHDLIEQAAKFIPHNAEVVIIPDGALDKLNFETLRVPNPQPHYWITDVIPEITSSTSLLLSSRKNGQRPGRTLLSIGNVQGTEDYPALPHAGEEMQKVQAHFPPEQVVPISGPDATPSVYASEHPEKYAYIHFATHGTASELSPLESAIILSPNAQHSFKLYARDIVRIHLNAKIVTISACYAAGTRAYSGEGLVGLAWAFLKAGAHQVVAGLWEVDDRVAANLMDDFYTGLEKESANKALRNAKLKLVNSDSVYSRPYYWASLQLYTGS
jgi:CHAT domain-containing protein/Tfp pilus assembly protein PilF